MFGSGERGSLGRRIIESLKTLEADFINHEDGFSIAAFARGGLFLASYIYYHFYKNCREFYVIKLRRADGEKEEYDYSIKPKIDFTDFDFSILKEKRILLVDDIFASGETIALAENYLRDHSEGLKKIDRNYEELKIVKAALVVNKKLISGGIYWGDICEDRDWIEFAWEK